MNARCPRVPDNQGVRWWRSWQQWPPPLTTMTTTITKSLDCLWFQRMRLVAPCYCKPIKPVFFVASSFVLFVSFFSPGKTLLISLVSHTRVPNTAPNRQSETQQRPWTIVGRTCAQQDVSRGLEGSVPGRNITCDCEIAPKSICGNYSLRAFWNSSPTSKSP